MERRLWKIASFIELGLIIILLIVIIHMHSIKTPNQSPAYNYSLLSYRINMGSDIPQNALIFNFKPLQKEISQYIESRDLNVSVYVLNMRDGASMSIRGGDELEPASLNKLPIAIEIMRSVESGKLNLNTQLSIKKSDINTKSGDLYQKNVSSMSVRELLYYMLSESDNTATLALLDHVDLEDLKEISLYLDYYVQVINTKQPENNSFTITPRSTSHLFMSLYLSTILTPENSQYLLSLLTNTSFNIKKYARLPEDVTVAQKYGSYHNGAVDYFHSCGILYIQDSRIFYCVMTRYLDENPASVVVGDIVHEIYQYVVDTRSQLKNNPL